MPSGVLGTAGVVRSRRAALGGRARPLAVRARGPGAARAQRPWGRAQVGRAIVPHPFEEAYELAGAGNSGGAAKVLDGLGDVLFQVHFLSLLLEERGAGDLGAVAEHCRQIAAEMRLLAAEHQAMAK